MELLTKLIPIISSSTELLLGRFSKTSIVTESVDVVSIRHRNSHIPYTKSITVDNMEEFSGYHTIFIDIISLFYII